MNCNGRHSAAYKGCPKMQIRQRASPQRDQGAIYSALGEHTKILVNVVRALVRSRLSYRLEAMPHLSKKGLARLTAIEVHGLRKFPCKYFR